MPRLPSGPAPPERTARLESVLCPIDSVRTGCFKMQQIMTWYYEILGTNEEVLEQSQPVYATHWEAQWAGYRRFKDELLPGPPTSGGEVKGGLRTVPVVQNIRAKEKGD